jgi:hypothetical protein
LLGSYSLLHYQVVGGDSFRSRSLFLNSELYVRSGIASTLSIVGEIEKDWSHVVIGDLVMFRYYDLRGAARCTDRS